MGVNLDELERDGWMVNQTRMWLASQWSVRHGADWREGEHHFFTHLLDRSRAANRLGWQWTMGTGTAKAYGFSQAQVRRRAPGLCGTCPHQHSCPIRDWPDDPPHVAVEEDPRLRRDPDVELTAGPEQAEPRSTPDAVWMTAESVGDDDPALAGRPLAATFAPVPGWRRRARSLNLAEVHPWPWLERPRTRSMASFSAWSKGR